MDENQYVVFNLQNEEYAININKVCEVNRLKEIKITKVPKVPYFIEGIINIRGDVVPVINLRKKIDIEPKNIDKQTRMIIVSIDSKMVGILVDYVSHVITLQSNEIIEPPEEVKINCIYITGVGRKGKRIIFILDIDKMLNLGHENNIEM